jgi:hypothetical protein
MVGAERRLADEKGGSRERKKEEEAGGRRQEAGGRRQEAGGRRQEGCRPHLVVLVPDKIPDLF